MPRFFVLFELGAGVDPDEYERWAREQDAPMVGQLPSVDGFEVFRIDGALEGEPPYRYVEVFDVDDMGQFEVEVSTAEMQSHAAAFRARAREPVFIFGERIV